MVFYSNVFRRSEYVQAFISQDRVVDLLRQVAGPDCWVRWDQCVVKNPGAPEFPWHQDNAYNRLKDAHYQFWIGLTAMDGKNGGLWLQPGSHLQGLLPHVRQANHVCCTRPPENARLIESEKGDVILFSSLMLHQTKPNESESERWAYVVEYMSLDDFDPLVKPPYFIVSEGGVPAPKWVMSYRASTRMNNRIKYLPLQIKESCKELAMRLWPFRVRTDDDH
jgi:ectoine hydroxylase-related dioxygenase (phytanoyl-CoA dioxygenase family)